MMVFTQVICFPNELRHFTLYDAKNISRAFKWPKFAEDCLKSSVTFRALVILLSNILQTIQILNSFSKMGLQVKFA